MSTITNLSAEAAVGRTPSRTLRALPYLLSFAVAAFAIYTAFRTVLMAVETYTPFLFGDQWTAVIALKSLDNHTFLRYLWAQHNEHRIPIPKLLVLLDLRVFGAKNISLFLEIFAVQVSHWMLLAWVTIKHIKPSRPVYITLLGYLGYCLFSPLQLENFVWGFQICFILVSFAASCCFASALCYSAQPPESIVKRKFFLFVAIGAAVISECSLASGLLCWPLLAIASFRLRFGNRDRWVIIVVGTLMTLLYVLGYSSPPSHSNPLETIQHPGALISYIVAYLAASWDGLPPDVIRWPRVAQSASLIAMAFVIFRYVRCIYFKDCTRAQVFLVTDLAFMLGTSLITALGRVNFGYGQAVSLRYQTVALLFWGCIALLLATQFKRLGSRVIIGSQVALLVLLFSAPGRWPAIHEWAKNRQMSLSAAWYALTQHSVDDPALLQIYPRPDHLMDFFTYLERRHLGPQVSEPKVVAVPKAGKILEFKTTTSSCLGFVDWARSTNINSFQISGWAYDFQHKTSDVHVAVTDAQGAIVAVGAPRISRPDVSSAVSSVKAANTGWLINIDTPISSEYHVFLVRDDDNLACPLQNFVEFTNH